MTVCDEDGADDNIFDNPVLPDDKDDRPTDAEDSLSDEEKLYLSNTSNCAQIAIGLVITNLSILFNSKYSCNFNSLIKSIPYLAFGLENILSNSSFLR
jgi:hypothetical protein